MGGGDWMRDDVLQVMREMRELLAEPERWTQRVLARTETHEATAPYYSDAVSWCLGGAIQKVIGELSPTIGYSIRNALDLAMRRQGSRAFNYVTWNDWTGRRHTDVLALLDLAIEIEEAGLPS